MSQPRVSCLMDVHADGEGIDIAVGSLATQRFADWELVLAVAPAARAAAERIAGWAGSDERIRVLRMSDETGPGGALNFAAGHARGEFIAYLETTAELAPDYIQRLAAFSRPCDVFVSGYDVVVHDSPMAAGASPDARSPAPAAAPLVASWDPYAVRTQLFARSIVRRLGIVHRRELLERAGGFNELVWDTPEWDLLKRFARLGAEVVFVKGRAGAYHLRGRRRRPWNGNQPSSLHHEPLPREESDGGKRGAARLIERITENQRRGQPLFGTRSGWMFPKRVERILFTCVQCLLDYTNGASLTVLQTLRWLNAHGFSAKAFCICDHGNPEQEHRDAFGRAERWSATGSYTSPREEPGLVTTGMTGAPLAHGDTASASPPLPTREEAERLGLPMLQREPKRAGAEVWQTLAVGIPLTVGRVAQNDPWRVTGDAREFLAVYESLLTEQRPDVVVTYGGDCLSLAMMEAAKHRDIPVVFWLHNFGYLNPNAFQFADYVIVPSEFSREFYWNAIGLGCHSLPNFIDWGRVQVTSTGRAAASEAAVRVNADNLPPPGDSLRTLEENVGSIPLLPTASHSGPQSGSREEGAGTRRYVTFVNPEPVKGVFVFAAICAELAARRPDIPMLVVEGRTPVGELTKIGIDLARLTNVTVMPRTADPRRFYTVTKLFLMPSLWNESFGLVAAEAMINGIPVLASNRGALPEVVGDGGFLFDVPAQCTPDSRTIPTADEIQPWIERIISLWDDPVAYLEASRRASARAEIWHPDRLGPRFGEFFAGVSPQPCPPIVRWRP